MILLRIIQDSHHPMSLCCEGAPSMMLKPEARHIAYSWNGVLPPDHWLMMPFSSRICIILLETYLLCETHLGVMDCKGSLVARTAEGLIPKPSKLLMEAVTATSDSNRSLCFGATITLAHKKYCSVLHTVLVTAKPSVSFTGLYWPVLRCHLVGLVLFHSVWTSRCHCQIETAEAIVVTK